MIIIIHSEYKFSRKPEISLEIFFLIVFLKALSSKLLIIAILKTHKIFLCSLVSPLKMNISESSIAQVKLNFLISFNYKFFAFLIKYFLINLCNKIWKSVSLKYVVTFLIFFTIYL